MRDVDDAHTVIAQLADEREQAIGLLHRQARGRLVHDDEPRIERERLRDFDELLLRDGKAIEWRGRGHGHAEALEVNFRVSVNLLPIDEAQLRTGFTTE